MKKLIFLSVIFFLLVASQNLSAQSSDSIFIKNIFNNALTDSTAYHNLRILTHNYGKRLAGTEQSQKSVEWAFKLLKSMGLDSVWMQECKVRHWDRGSKEVAKVISSKSGNHNLNICALGGSVGTGLNGLTAKVVEISNYDDLKRLGKENVKGKIVFINHPADPTLYNTFAAYGGAVGYRARGAIQAAYYGAVAMIDRSSTTIHDYSPHTGIQHYADTVNKIPAISISTNDADNLSSWLKKDPNLSLFVKMTCRELPEVVSHDVIGEIRGTDYPDQIIAFGGHLDCWDICQGAHDDGAGLVQSIDVLRLYKSLNLRPKHTIRAIVFIDEEMEQRGARAYADAMKHTKHIAAIEADRGGFTPVGFSIDGNPDQVKKVQSWKNLLIPYGLYYFEKGGSGVDVNFLKPMGIPLLGLVPDSQRYFDYHHSVNDSFDKVNIRELQLGTASIATIVFLIDKYGL